MIGSRSEIEEKISSSISQPFQTLIDLPAKSFAMSPSESLGGTDYANFISEIESALRDILGTDAPSRVKLLDEPLTGSDLDRYHPNDQGDSDRSRGIGDKMAQDTNRWLRSEKLNAAREREAELFEIVFAGKNPVGLKVLPASGPSRRVRGRYKVANK